MSIALELFLACLAALGISLGLNRLMLVLAPRLGLMDEPGERRIHSKAIPRAGGLAVWLSFLIVLAVGLAMQSVMTYGGHLTWRWLGAFAAGSGVLIAAGIVDDRRGLSPWVKLCAHIAAPVVFFTIEPVRSGLFNWEHAWLADFLVFVGWTVVLINAFNLIDGLDGLCGGLAAVATFALAGLALANHRMDAAMLLVTMGGAILGFLRYNFNPARIFLGDAGSMVLGFFLAAAATEAVGRKAIVGILLLPIAVAGVPLLDLLLAVWRRAARKLALQLRGEEAIGGLFDADAEHLHHRLLEGGQSQRKTALILQGIAILLTVIAFLPMLFGSRLLALSLVGFLIVLLIGIRNLARVEIEQTGRVVHLAIKLPGRRRRYLIALLVYDLLVMLMAGALAITMETNRFVLAADYQGMFRFVLVFVICASFFLWRGNVHQKIWIRSTIRDLASLQLALFVAALASFTALSVLNVFLEWSMLRLALLTYVLASLGICLPRVALDMLRDMGSEIRYKHPKPSKENGTGFGAVVILGSGDLGTLFLDHLKSSPHDYYGGMKIIGFIDDRPELSGRYIRQYRVLGDLSIVPELVESRQLQGIVVAIAAPPAALIAQLQELARTHGLKIHRWSADLTLADSPEKWAAVC